MMMNHFFVLSQFISRNLFQSLTLKKSTRYRQNYSIVLTYVACVIANGEQRFFFLSVSDCANQIIKIMDICGIQSLHPYFDTRPDREKSDVGTDSPKAAFQRAAIYVVRKGPWNVKGHDLLY